MSSPRVMPEAPRPPRLLDRVRELIRARHYSRRTERAYVGWIRRFILFHDKRHPDQMGAAQVAQFLTSLATAGRVSASTQNQARCATRSPRTCSRAATTFAPSRSCWGTAMSRPP